MRRADGPTPRTDLSSPTRPGDWSFRRLAPLVLFVGLMLPGVAALATTLPDESATRAAGNPPAPTGFIERAGASSRAPGTVPTLNEAEALRVSEAAVGRRIPDATLLDRQGKPVSLSSYRGKPLLVSFIYTGCFEICPTQTRALHDAVRGLDVLLGSHQFNVVSIGFNQPFDTHQAMRAFAAQQRIDYPNWEFLSPAPDLVESLTDAFGFSYQATPAGFDHVLGVTVVDAEGYIHSQVYGDRLRADQLGVPLRRILLDAPPPPSMSTLAAVVERVRILCTVYDKDTGEYRYDYKLIFEIIGGALFFLTMAVYFLLEWRNRRRARKRASCTTDPQASGSVA
ncbi:MAG: SCO family protein [Burkholderiaceae bacterium]